MSYKITINEENAVVELFLEGVSPDEIIPADALVVTDEEGEMLRMSGNFGLYEIRDGAVFLKEV